MLRDLIDPEYFEALAAATQEEAPAPEPSYGIQDPLAGPIGNHVDEAQQILIRIAETHAAPHAGLIQRGRPRQIKGHHTLVSIPDVHHAIRMLIRCLSLEHRQQVIPIKSQAVEGLLGVMRVQVTSSDRPDSFLEDQVRPRFSEFRVVRILMITENEDDCL